MFKIEIPQQSLGSFLFPARPKLLFPLFRAARSTWRSGKSPFSLLDPPASDSPRLLSTSSSSFPLSGARRRGRRLLRVTSAPRAYLRPPRASPGTLGSVFPLLSSRRRRSPVPPVSSEIRRRPCSFPHDCACASSCSVSQLIPPCSFDPDAVSWTRDVELRCGNVFFLVDGVVFPRLQESSRSPPAAPR